MRVVVLGLERHLVDVLVSVAFPAVLMRMDDVLMLVAGVRVGVRLALVLVLMRVRLAVLVVVAHVMASFSWGRGRGVGAPDELAVSTWSMWLSASASKRATWESKSS